MLNYCIVKQRIGAITEDTPDDDDRYPDYTSVFGQVVFAPTMANGSAYKITDGDGLVHTVPATRITAQIVNGEITHEGLPGLPLFAAGSNANPSTIVYTATYTNLTAAGLPITLNSITFRAVPGETIDLSSYTPVAGAPTPGIIQGPPGHTPFIGQNGNWWINGKDTGVVATSPLVHSYTELTEAFEENTMRVKSLEAMNGVSPESPVDGQTANLIEQDDTLTRAALASNFAEVGADGKLVGGVMPTLALAASPATGVNVTTGPQIEVFTFLNGELIGYQGGRLYTSKDGVNWDDAGSSPLGYIPRKILMTLDGELMCSTSPSLYRSSGWGTGTLTWSKKMDATPGSGIQPFGFNGRAGKYIVTEYSGARETSRYAYISTDDGHTFTQVWDSNEMHGPVNGPLTHIHGVEYDHYADRFYLSEGHTPASAGLHVSVDDGATWMHPPGLSEDPGPTTIDVTPDGLVCGSDSGRAGILGVVRQDNPMDEKFIHTWAWPTGKDGVSGFGASSFRDESTGIVYIGFRVSYPDVHPVIAGGTPTAAGLVWEWDGGPSTNSDDLRNPVVANGRLYAIGKLSGQTRHIRGRIASPGVPADPSQSRVIGTKLSVGVGATAVGLGGVAVGNLANSSGVQASTAVGYNSSAVADSTALGHSAAASVGGTALGYRATNVVGGDQLAVGARAETTGPAGIAIGSRAKSSDGATSVGVDATGASRGVAVGGGAKAGLTGVAVGRNADSTNGDHSVVVGPNAKSNQGWSTSIGTDSSSSSYGVALGPGAAAASSSVTIGASSTTGVSGVAIGRNAESGQNMIAIGRDSKATITGTIAIGEGTVATAARSVAFGARSLHLEPVASAPASPLSGCILYIRDIGGVPSLCVRMSSGPEMVIAPPPVPEPVQE